MGAQCSTHADESAADRPPQESLGAHKIQPEKTTTSHGGAASENSEFISPTGKYPIPSWAVAGARALDNTINFQMAYNQFLEGPGRAWWNSVTNMLIVGAIPCRNKNHHSHLHSVCGVRAVVSLVMLDEFKPSIWGTPVTEDDWKNLNVAQLVRVHHFCHHPSEVIECA